MNSALRLPEGERVRLARQILQSVEPFELTDAQRAELREAMAEIDRGEYVEGEEVRSEEIERRARAVEDGTAVLEDWDEVRQRTRARLQHP